jgi:hypothetical protein
MALAQLSSYTHILIRLSVTGLNNFSPRRKNQKLTFQKISIVRIFEELVYWLRFRICIVGSGFNVKICGECLGFNLAKVKVGPLGSSQKKKVLLLLNLNMSLDLS